MKYYTILKVSEQPPKTWEGSFGPMETYKVMLEGVDEPVEINRKPGNVPKVAESIYGEVNSTEYGYKFKPEKKPFGKSNYQPRPDHHEEIKAQWAIGQAVTIYNATNDDQLGPHMNVIEKHAKELFAMVDRVKGSVVTDSQDKVHEPTADELEAVDKEILAGIPF